MIGGLRSGMGYVGAANLQQLRDEAQFIQMSGSGLKESHPHDVQITKKHQTIQLNLKNIKERGTKVKEHFCLTL